MVGKGAILWAARGYVMRVSENGFSSRVWSLLWEFGTTRGILCKFMGLWIGASEFVLCGSEDEFNWIERARSAHKHRVGCGSIWDSARWPSVLEKSWAAHQFEWEVVVRSWEFANRKTFYESDSLWGRFIKMKPYWIWPCIQLIFLLLHNSVFFFLFFYIVFCSHKKILWFLFIYV